MAKPNWLSDLCKAHGVDAEHSELAGIFECFRASADQRFLFWGNDKPAMHQAFLAYILALTGHQLSDAQVKRAMTKSLPELIKRANREAEEHNRRWREQRAREDAEREAKFKRKEEERAANLRCNYGGCWKNELGDDTVVEGGKIYHSECSPSFQERARAREVERQREKASEYERRALDRERWDPAFRRLRDGTRDAQRHAEIAEGKLAIRKAELAKKVAEWEKPE